jgi:hypothetical protein
MQYSELIARLNRLGLDKIGGLVHGKATSSKHATVMIGRPSEVVFPFQFQFHTLYRPADQDDWDVSDEEIAALKRRFKISDTEWQSTG